MIDTTNTDAKTIAQIEARGMRLAAEIIRKRVHSTRDQVADIILALADNMEKD